MSSTICALATPPGAGGIAVVRVSGPEAYAVVGEIFTPRNPAKRVAEAKGYTAMLGHYHLRGEEMDETIALFFRTRLRACWKRCTWPVLRPPAPASLPAAHWKTAA